MENGKARICILANKKLNVFMLHSYSNQDTTKISWETGSNKYRLVLCNLPYEEEEVSSQLIKELVRDSEASRCLTILGCDSNAHHTLWGNTDINGTGELLFNYLLDTRLLLSNRGNMPTFVTRNRQKVLDITLMSAELINRLTF